MKNLGAAILLVLGLSGCSGLVSSGGEEGSSSQGLMADLRQHFRSFEIVKLDRAQTRAALAARTGITIVVNGVERVLDLEPHDLRAAHYVAIDTGAAGDVALDVPDPRTYRGVVRGEDGSQVRVSLSGEDEVQGFVTIAGARSYLQPARAYSAYAAAGDLVVYPQGALIDAPAPTCAEGQIEVGQAMAPATSGTTQTTGTVRVLEIATDADAQLVTDFGAAGANQQILQVLNLVDGVYESELGIAIQVVFQHTWSTPDPYDGSSQQNLLNSFLGTFNASYGTVARDVAHLFSRKSIVYSASSIAGIAYVGEACNLPYAYGVSGLHSQQLAQYALTAHELGHNLGASHAYTFGGTTQPHPDCAGTIMQDVNASQLHFCGFSTQEIGGYVAASGGCLAVRQQCVPTTCAAAGASCGSVSDGCGGTLDCGTCSGGQTCGGGGQANVCGTAPYLVNQWGAPGDRPLVGDFYGDGHDELTVLRPSDLVWYMRQVDDGTGVLDPRYVRWGYVTDAPVAADFYGLGRDQLAQFRGSDGVWYFLDVPTGEMRYRQWGVDGDVPFAGRLLGGAAADIAIYRPSTGDLWVAQPFGDTYVAVPSGVTGAAQVFAGDFIGTGHDQAAIYQGGQWTFVDLVTGARVSIAWGTAGDIPVPGPILSTRSAMAVYRPSEHNFYVLETGGASTVLNWGADGDVPVVGKFLRTDRANMAQFRPSTGEWFIWR